jgi:prepilin-type processing-associated H-X9-DG protein
VNSFAGRRSICQVCPSAVKANGVYVTEQDVPCAYVLNNLYGLFEKAGRSPAKLAEIENADGTVFCGDGGAPSGVPFQIYGRLELNASHRPPSLTSIQGGFYGRYNDGCNVVFLDGHAKWLTISELGKKNASDRYPYFTPEQD